MLPRLGKPRSSRSARSSSRSASSRPSRQERRSNEAKRRSSRSNRGARACWGRRRYEGLAAFGCDADHPARGSYGAFTVKSAPHSPVNFKAKARSPIDLVVRRHDYVVGARDGIAQPPRSRVHHRHPGPAHLLPLRRSELLPHVVSTGQGFVDDGRGHAVRNESGRPAQDVSVIVAPVGGAFRGELNAPGPFCDLRSQAWRARGESAPAGSPASLTDWTDERKPAVQPRAVPGVAEVKDLLNVSTRGASLSGRP